MWATRYQFPIGQGCFHAGVIGLADSESKKIHYIYDCGSKKQHILQNAIDFYKAQTSFIDNLFVSHFDDDHVSGLDRLLAAVEVNTVYIPYVDQSVLILDLIEAEMNGALSASLIEASIEPESWFGRRGVQRVVRIQGSGDSPPDESPDSTPNDSPKEPTEGIHQLSNEQEAGENLTATEVPPPTRKQPGITGERSELLLAEPGFRIIISASHMIPGWLLLPHVDPAPKERLSSFRSAMRIAIGLQPRQRLTSAILAEALRDVKKRDRLRECYDEIIARGARRYHNRVSMSLYSGPMDKFRQTWEYWIQTYPFFRWSDMGWPSWEPEPSPLLWGHKTDAVGWLGTGDAALRMKKVRKRWQETYQSLEDQISTLLLPHHGSRHNFHWELLQFPNLKLCVASAGNPSQYNHPNGEVVATIQEHEKIFCHVSQHLHSGFIEKMFLVRNTDDPLSV